jgi:hypothetical protein
MHGSYFLILALGALVNDFSLGVRGNEQREASGQNGIITLATHGLLGFKHLNESCESKNTVNIDYV